MSSKRATTTASTRRLNSAPQPLRLNDLTSAAASASLAQHTPQSATPYAPQPQPPTTHLAHQIPSAEPSSHNLPSSDSAIGAPPLDIYVPPRASDSPLAALLSFNPNLAPVTRNLLFPAAHLAHRARLPRSHAVTQGLFHSFPFHRLVGPFFPSPSASGSVSADTAPPGSHDTSPPLSVPSSVPCALRGSAHRRPSPSRDRRQLLLGPQLALSQSRPP